MSDKRNKLSVRALIQFNEIAVESHQDAIDAVNQALAEMREHCSEKMRDALELVGAKDVTVSLTVV